VLLHSHEVEELPFSCVGKFESDIVQKKDLLSPALLDRRDSDNIASDPHFYFKAE
jgi:hypothetical protein